MKNELARTTVETSVRIVVTDIISTEEMAGGSGSEDLFDSIVMADER